jgi:hypothetical protein
LGTSPPVEREIARDLARRGALIAPIVVAVALAVRGTDGAIGAAVALAIVVLNLVGAASAQGWAAMKSAATLGAVVLGGYIGRLAVVTVAIVLLRHATWLDFPTFGLTLAVSHLGLLAWEARSVSLTLAFPGLKPATPATGGKD